MIDPYSYTANIKKDNKNKLKIRDNSNLKKKKFIEKIKNLSDEELRQLVQYAERL